MPNPRNLRDYKKSYQLLDGPNKLHSFFYTIQTKERFSFSLITNSSDKIKNDQLLGISFYTIDNIAYYLPLSKNYFSTDVFSRINVELKNIFSNPNLLKISYNIDSFMRLLDLNHISLAQPFFDVKAESILLSESNLHDMTYLVKKYFDHNRVSTNTLLQKTANKELAEMDIDLLSYYACEDAYYCFHLHYLLTKKLKQKNLVHHSQNHVSSVEKGDCIAN